MIEGIVCDNGCNESAMCSLTWPTSVGPQAANMCQRHADEWWETYKHTHAGESVIIGNPKSTSEIEAITGHKEKAA